MRHITGEYATKNQWAALGRWAVNMLVILGVTSFVVLACGLWGYLS